MAKKTKLSEANKKAAEMIQKLAQAEIKKIPNTEYDIDVLFWIRDGIKDNPLDPDELEAYDDCYGLNLYK